MSMNEHDIIQKARQGDQDAFCQLYGQYRHRLYRYAFYRLGNERDAEDAVSDCVLSAWQQIGSLRDPKAFPAWIFRILSGCCAKLIRQQIDRRKEDPLEPDTGAQAAGAGSFVGTRPTGTQATATGDIPGTEDSLLLRDALATLPEEDRNIVLLSIVAGFKSQEIASMTGLTAGSVRSRLSRNLKKLRAFLEEQMEIPS